MGIAAAARPAVSSAQCPIHFVTPLNASLHSGPRLATNEPNWPSDPYSAELWLQRYLADGHPWAVPRAADAEVVFLLTNLTAACRRDRMYTIASRGPILCGAITPAPSRPKAVNAGP
jgi:hypothetical protein